MSLITKIDESPELFKDREALVHECQHSQPVNENGILRCPKCGDIAEVKFDDEGIEYYGY